SFFEDILSGTSDQAIEGMLVLNRQCGMICGPTSGLSYYAMIERLKRMDQEIPEGISKKKVAFIACDRLEPYMSYIQARRPEIFAEDSSSKPKVKGMSESEIAQGQELTSEELAVLSKDQLEKPIILDTRSFFAFQTGHIPGSINVLDEYLVQLVEEGPI